jgi:hypothetical protein
VHRELNDLRDLTDEIELGHSNFLYIPKANKDEAIDDLHDFMPNINDADLTKVLAVAFESPMVLDNFKKIIARNPSLHEQLEIYLKERAKKRLLQWLSANALAVAEGKVGQKE